MAVAIQTFRCRCRRLDSSLSVSRQGARAVARRRRASHAPLGRAAAAPRRALFGPSPLDPATCALILVGVAVFAAIFPTRRATQLSRCGGPRRRRGQDWPARGEFPPTADDSRCRPAAAATYAQIRAGLERASKPIGPLDTLIAAQAVARKLTLVSNNRKEFSRVPRLAIENWADRA